MTAFNMGHGGNGPERNFSAKEERKLRKPIIEKKRRERINCSLEQLKGIMVDAYNLDQSKLEKADVLEVTVQHMESLQKGQGSGSPSGPSIGFESRQRYSSGYIQCMHEVHNLLLSCPGMDKPLGARLLNHLLKSLPHISSETGTGNTGDNGTNGFNGTPTRAIGNSNGGSNGGSSNGGSSNGGSSNGGNSNGGSNGGSSNGGSSNGGSSNGGSSNGGSSNGGSSNGGNSKSGGSSNGGSSNGGSSNGGSSNGGSSNGGNSKSGGSSNGGSSNGGSSNGGSSNGGSSNGGSSMPGSGPASSPQSPLFLPSGGGPQSFRPRCLQMHLAKPPSQPSPPPIGSSPLHAPRNQVHSGRDGRDQQKSFTSSPPSSPTSSPNLPQPGVFHPAPLSPFFPPGGDPSMWRPW